MQSPAIPVPASVLGRVIDLEALPASHLLPPEDAGAAIGIAPTSLAVWRSTGRYSLPFVKSGRKVFYRVGDLKEFLARRTKTHTGE